MSENLTLCGRRWWRITASIILFFFFIEAVYAGAETLITTGTSGSNQYHPSVWGNYIVWQDDRNSGSDIYLYNISNGNETRLTGTGAHAYEPHINGTKIVWFESYSDVTYSIILYDIVLGNPQTIFTSTGEPDNPALFDANIVWQWKVPGSGDWDILIYNTGSGLVSNLTTNTPLTSQKNPTIYGNKVVWQEYDTVSDSDELYSADIGGVPQRLTDDLQLNQRNAALFGSDLVWQDDSSTNLDFDIYHSPDILSTPAATKVLSPFNESVAGDDQQINPAIYRNHVYWLDARPDYLVDSNYLLFGFDLANFGNASYQISSSSAKVSSSSFPSAYHDRVVWEDTRNSLSDIFMYNDSGTGSCPVASFTQNKTNGAPTLAVQFTDTSSGSRTFWQWDFGDGRYSTDQNPVHTFSSGTYQGTLTTGNPSCRNATQTSGAHTFSVGVAPVVTFTGSPLEGLAPFTVQFTDSSTGSPTLWNWSFGDGCVSSMKNPAHLFSVSGTYSVNLTASNPYGNGTLTKTAYISGKEGIRAGALTDIPGIVAAVAGAYSTLAFDTTAVTNFSVSGDQQTLVTRPAPAYGWQNITFFSADNFGFSGLSPIEGNFSSVSLYSNDIIGSTFSGSLGSLSRSSYHMVRASYPQHANLTIEMFEGMLPADDANFERTIIGSGYASKNVAYTMNISRISMTAPSSATVNMSVLSTWVGVSSDLVKIIANENVASGNPRGTVLPVRYIFSSGSYDYFEADIPANVSYMSKFALAKLSGSGNVFQMVYLVVTEHYGGSQQPVDSDSEAVPGGGKSTGQGLVSQQNLPLQHVQLVPPAAPTAKSVDLYINEQGVVTQTTVLEAADQLATIAIGQGVAALDANGNPLSSVSIETLSADHISGMPSQNTLSFAGLAYNFQPDGATFSPSATITFTVPNAQWSQQYTVREFDAKSGSWIDLPTTYNPESGAISASVSHFCCIALFSNVIPSKVPVTASVTTLTPPKTIPTPAPSTQLGIFYNMVIFISGIAVKNLYLVLIVIAIITALYMRGRRGRLDKIRYKF
jgi:beta propeller repeat protein